MDVPERSAPTMQVLANYSDRELLDALLDPYDEMPDNEKWDFDREGIDIYSQITVPRLILREALRRVNM